jgi:hypothetical protein
MKHLPGAESLPLILRVLLSKSSFQEKQSDCEAKHKQYKCVHIQEGLLIQYKDSVSYFHNYQARIK